MTTLNQPPIAALLETGYRPEQTAAIRSFMSDFEVFSDGFMPVEPTIAENNGVKLLLMRCPLGLDYLGLPPNAQTSPVALGVLFTPHFPANPPVCAILVDKDSGLRLPDAPWLSSTSGSVRLQAVPELRDATNPPLIDIILGVSSALAQDKVIGGPAAGTVPVATQPPQGGSPGSSSPPQPPPPGVPPPEGLPPGTSSFVTTGAPYTVPSSASVGLPSAASSPSAVGGGGPLSPAALSAIRNAMDASIADFVIQFEAAERRDAELRESEATLRSLATSLSDKEATLHSAVAQLKATEAALQAATTSGAENTDPLTSLTAGDDVRRQAAELLGEVLAYDDLIAVYEKRLKKGNLSETAYMRLVGDAARHQFIAKYKLKKAHGIATAEQSFASLTQRFPQLEARDVATVLAECHFNLAEAARTLGDMTGAAAGPPVS